MKSEFDEDFSRRSTLATTVYRRLRDDLLNGILGSGAKLRIDWVVTHYSSGASPVREALNRLAAEGLIDRHDQRGFFVKSVNAAELQELTRTRCWLEERGLRESFANRTSHWDEQIVLALHRLSRATAQVQEIRSSRDTEWERVHLLFHRSLISGCKSKWLMAFCDQIADQLRRYRLLGSPHQHRQRDCMAEHRNIAEAALNGEEDRAVAALIAHYERSAACCDLQATANGRSSELAV